MSRRLLFVAAVAVALVTGALAGVALGEGAPGHALTLRRADGSFVAYLARDGRALLRTAAGYEFLEVETAQAGALVNSLAALASVATLDPRADGYTLALDNAPAAIAIADPRSELPSDPALRALVDTLWRSIDGVPTVAATAPSIRVRLTPLDATPSPFFTPRDVFTIAAATSSAGERISGERLARLIAVNPVVGSGIDARPFAVFLDGAYYRVDWTPEPAPDELQAAPDAP